MDGKDIIAALEIQSVDRLYQISREIENVDTAAVVQLSVREWLRHLQSLDRATYDCELLLASEAVG